MEGTVEAEKVVVPVRPNGHCAAFRTDQERLAARRAKHGDATSTMAERAAERAEKREALKRQYATNAQARREKERAEAERAETAAAARLREERTRRKLETLEAQALVEAQAHRRQLHREQLELARLHRCRALALYHGWRPWRRAVERAAARLAEAAAFRDRRRLRGAVGGLREHVRGAWYAAAMREVAALGRARDWAWRRRAAEGLQGFMYNFIDEVNGRRGHHHRALRLLAAGLAAFAQRRRAARARLAEAQRFQRYGLARGPLVAWHLHARRVAEEEHWRLANLTFRAQAWAAYRVRWKGFQTWRKAVRMRKMQRMVGGVQADLANLSYRTEYSKQRRQRRRGREGSEAEVGLGAEEAAGA